MPTLNDFGKHPGRILEQLWYVVSGTLVKVLKIVHCIRRRCGVSLMTQGFKFMTYLMVERFSNPLIYAYPWRFGVQGCLKRLFIGFLTRMSYFYFKRNSVQAINYAK